jgi:hypothetical protein
MTAALTAEPTTPEPAAAPGLAVILCAVPAGTTRAYKCSCCGIETDDPDLFATTSCWGCAFAANTACKTCLAHGIEVSRFGDGDVVAHVLRDATVTCCGLPFDPASWTGPADLPVCTGCTPAV